MSPESRRSSARARSYSGRGAGSCRKCFGPRSGPWGCATPGPGARPRPARRPDGPVGEPQSDVPGAVGATIEHDHGLVAERHRADPVPAIMGTRYHGRMARVVPPVALPRTHSPSSFRQIIVGETAAARGPSQSRPPDVPGPLDPVRSGAFSTAAAGERSVSGIIRAAENIMASH